MPEPEPEPFSHGAAETAPTSSIATAMLFGTVIFATSGLAARTWLNGDGRAIRAALHPRSSPLDARSYESVYTLLHHFSVLGCILFLAYVCEYHPPFPHSEKSYDRDEFFFLTALLFLASAYTVHRNDGGDDSRKRGGASRVGGRASSVVSAVSVGDGGTQAASTNGDGGDGDSYDYDASTVLSGQSSRSGRSTMVRPIADVVPANDVLSRDQTEEWKGWMQFIFLLYHYYHAEEVYNSIRIMITCYVWMTGFGNFSFFYLKGDYSIVRVLQMLWRLNFLVIFLCLSQGTTYILYYICPLHTYFFLMVYLTMWVGNRINYTKYGVRLKMGVVALLIFIFWDLDSGLFRLVHLPILGEVPILGATGGSMWEWYFRTTLDHWSTFLGMVFALNYPITSLFYRKLEAQSRRLEWLGKGAVGAALFACFYVWVTGPFTQAKLQYNATNAYFGFIPLITYIYFRNLTPTLREYSLDLLHQIGKTTLETYLMQHHIWLTSNAKSLLVLIPGWPRVNFLVVTVMYFYTSRRLYRLTLYLRGMLLPDDRSACLRSLLWMAVAIGSFYGLALTLDSFGMTSLVAVAIVSAVCGSLLYVTVMDTTWKAYRDSAPPLDDDGSHAEGMEKPVTPPDSSIARLSAPLIGTLVLLILGMTWHGLAETGAGKIRPLKAECGAFVNDGRWVPLDGCNEGSRGEGYRSYGTANFATCGTTGGTYVWGWNATKSYTHCRFARRDAKSLKKTLNHRTLTFVGDSMTRNIYHATLRILGVTGSGSYDATGPKHADITNSVGSIAVDFRWAPLAADQFTALKEINGKGRDAEDKPDLIVMGGGAWDRLHQFATDQDQDTLKGKLGELAKEIRTAKDDGMPVAWLVPTTINDPALNTEEKRDHMTEGHIEEMRELYENRGILSSSSFVLDGPAFTADRVRESYDGVHYPPQVYDAGAQILANAMDWLLLERDTSDPWNPNQPGKMANPFLGLMMLCFVFVGLMFFDGFMGFSYLASVFVRGVMPNDLYEEAFAPLHRKMKLPAIRSSSRSSSISFAPPAHGGNSRRRSGAHNEASESANAGPDSQDQHTVMTNASTVDEEIAALLGEKR